MLLKNILAVASLAAAAFAAPAAEKRQNRKMKWFGINESGAEFGEKNFPGVYGKDFIWYDFNTIDVRLVFLFLPSPQAPAITQKSDTDAMTNSNSSAKE